MPELLAEAGERLETADASLGVEPVGELCANAAGCPGGGTGGEFVAFDEYDVAYSGAGEVMGDAGAHDTTADDRGTRGGGNGKDIGRSLFLSGSSVPESGRVVTAEGTSG